jgi:hypothetical protein
MTKENSEIYTSYPRVSLERFDNAATQRIQSAQYWALSFLNPKTIEFLQKAEKELNELLAEEPIMQEVLPNHKGTYNLSAALAKLESTKKRGSKENIVQLAQQEQVLVSKIWKKNWHIKLSDPATWEQFKDEKADKASSSNGGMLFLKELWKFPELHRKSHCLLHKILAITNSTLPVLYQTLRTVERSEKSAKNMSAGLKEQLKELIGHFENIKKQAIVSANIRLQIAHEVPDIQLNGDIIAYTMNRLKNLRRIPSTEIIFDLGQPLSKDDFQRFKLTIEAQQDFKLAENLAKKLAQRGAGEVPDGIRFCQKTYLVVPHALRTYMPNWAGWPAFLFSDRHACIKFFKDKQYAFAQFKKPLTELFVENTAGDPDEKIAEFLDKLDVHVAFAFRERQDVLIISAGFFQTNYRNLLHAWKNMVGIYHQNCLLKYVDSLECLVRLPLPENPVQLQKRIRLIRRLEKQLEAQLKYSDNSAAIKYRYHAAKSKFRESETEPKVLVVQILGKLADAENLSLIDLKMLSEMLETFYLSSEIEVLSDRFTKEAAAEEALEMLKKQIMKPVNKSNFSELMSYGKVVLFLSAGKSAYLDTWLESLIINQMPLWESMSVSDAQTSMSMVEELIENLGSSSFKTRLEPLRTTEKNEKSYKYFYAEMIEKFAAPHIDQYVDDELSRLKGYMHNHLCKIKSIDSTYRAAFELLPKLMVSQGVDKICHLNSSTINPLYLLNWQATKEGRDHPEVRVFLELQAKIMNAAFLIRESDGANDKHKILKSLNKMVVEYFPTEHFFAKRFLHAEKFYPKEKLANSVFKPALM